MKAVNEWLSEWINEQTKESILVIHIVNGLKLMK